MPSTNETNRKAYFIEIMKRRILSGELKPGDRIPPERELAAELGISRGSVNQGMLDLARMGFPADRATQGCVCCGICEIGDAGNACLDHEL